MALILRKPVVFATILFLVGAAFGAVGSTKAKRNVKGAQTRPPAGWGEYNDGTYKFSIKFPPGWNVLVEDRQWMKAAGGMRDQEAAISFGDDMVAFSIVVYSNPQQLSAKQWFDRDVKEAGRSWGGRWSILAEHPIMINGQKGYAALMEMPESHDKRIYFTWGGRAYMIYYSRWWPLMTTYERRNDKSRYATLETMLQTFRKIE